MKKDQQKKPRLGSVRSVEQKLYAKNVKLKEYERQGFHPHETASDLETTWNTPARPQEVSLIEKKTPKATPLTVFAKILIASGLFFVFSVLAAFMVFYLQTNQVEYNAVRLAVLGPNSIAGGEPLQFDISVTNDNPVDVVLSDVVVTYPRGTISADSDGLPLEKDIHSFEEIRSGLSETAGFEAVLFGTEGETQAINIVFQYRVPGSDIIFFKERSYQVTVEKAPVVLSVDHQKEFQQGDEVEVVVEVSSNASQSLSNLFLSIDYPFGFEFATASHVGLDESSYVVGTLDPGETYTLVFRGVIRGQNNEERTIRYILGSEDHVRPGRVGTVFTNTESLIRLTEPPIGLLTHINSENRSVVAAYPDQDIDVLVTLTNSLTTKILDGVIQVDLEGSGISRRSIEAREGLYRSRDDTISWTGNDNRLLRELEPQAETEVLFSFTTLESREMAGVIQNPEIVLTTHALATNFEVGGEERQVTHEVQNRITIATEPTINSYLLHSEGPLENSGPIRPIVGENTTYTWVLEVSNTTNTLEDVEVTATLPRYVSLRDIFVPEDAQVDYDERSRQVTWTLDSVRPGVGYTTLPKQVYLSVAYEPSLDQINQSPDIIENIALKARDIFAQVVVTDTMRDLDTTLEADPAFGNQSGTVREAEE